MYAILSIDTVKMSYILLLLLLETDLTKQMRFENEFYWIPLTYIYSQNNDEYTQFCRLLFTKPDYSNINIRNFFLPFKFKISE